MPKLFMKGTLVFATILFCSSYGAAKSLQLCGKTPYSILIHVDAVKNDKGNVTVALYDDDPERFLKKGEKLGHLRVPAIKGTTSVCIAAPHIGDYAIVAYHDEDGNGRITRSWIGLPTEGFGFSNNPDVLLAPPKHSEAIVLIEAEKTILNIKIQY